MNGDDISIRTTEEMEKYESFRRREFAHTHIYDMNLLERVGLDEELFTILQTIGWGKLYDEPHQVLHYSLIGWGGTPQLHRTTSHSQVSSYGGSIAEYDYTTSSPSRALVGHLLWWWLLGSP
jgi:hypothetical protein